MISEKLYYAELKSLMKFSLKFLTNMCWKKILDTIILTKLQKIFRMKLCAGHDFINNFGEREQMHLRLLRKFICTRLSAQVYYVKPKETSSPIWTQKLWKTVENLWISYFWRSHSQKNLFLWPLKIR